ncbi:hypothetical protein HYO44_19445 [Vibrio parahaemolyticus]|nr:hypothetical protein [Vibrio parahaemolyticus]
MREVIITDLTRFSTNEKVCTAAIDVNTGECFRPMPYLLSARCEELGIHPGAILKGNLDFKAVLELPHTEDANYSDLQFHGACSGELFKQVLDASLSNTIVEGFDYDFAEGQKHIPHDTLVNVSIITVRVRPCQLSIHEDMYKPGKIKATLIDNDGHRYPYLSITDRGFFDFAKKHQDDGRLHEVTNLINRQEEVYLRIGLSRRFDVSGRDGYWLQVNGIYTFPQFHREVRSYE